MALIPLYEAKTYLRVDSSDEDALIGILLSSAEQMCKDVGRLSEDQWEAVNAADRDVENGVQPTRELEALRSTCRVAILYALGYLYEHRDEADHTTLPASAMRPSFRMISRNCRRERHRSHGQAVSRRWKSFPVGGRSEGRCSQ